MRVRNLITGETGIVVFVFEEGVHVVLDNDPSGLSRTWKNGSFQYIINKE